VTRRYRSTTVIAQVEAETLALLTGGALPMPEAAVRHAQGQLAWPPTAPDGRYKLVRVERRFARLARQLQKRLAPSLERFAEQMRKAHADRTDAMVQPDAPDTMNALQRVRAKWLAEHPEEN
jgi:hypothetical protein